MRSRRTASQPELPLRGPRELVSCAHVGLLDRTIAYTIARGAKRRAISLTIDERGLRVGAPAHATHTDIEAMLRKHAAWIVRKLAEWQSRPSPPRWVDGETLMLLGEPVVLRLLPGPAQPRRVGATLETGAAAGDLAATVTAWLKREALACFRSRVACFQEMLAVPAPDVRLSSARTRWGSCNAAGRVRLNWRLVQFPLRLVDYVVVHELAHLREMNHSPRFWTVVAGVLPDYATLRREIRTRAHHYLRV